MPPFIENLVFFLRRVNPWTLFAVSAILFIFVVLPTLNRLFFSLDTRVKVNPKDLRSPQYAYRMDEFGLLQIASDNIQEMEKKKQYGDIYERYGSKAFKKSLDRRDFLKMSNCAEQYLGEIIEFDRMNLGFKRQGAEGAQPLDVLTRRVRRARGEIFEQLVFVGTGVDFKLNGLYWVTTNNHFLDCIEEVSKESAERAKQAQLEQEQAKLKAEEEVKAAAEAKRAEEAAKAFKESETASETEKPSATEDKPQTTAPAKPAPEPEKPAVHSPGKPEPAPTAPPQPIETPPPPPADDNPTHPGSDD